MHRKTNISLVFFVSDRHYHHLMQAKCNCFFKLKVKYNDVFITQIIKTFFKATEDAEL